MKSIKVLNTLFDERFGGPQSRVLQVGRHLQMIGYETIIVIPSGGVAAERLLQGGLKVHEISLVRLRQTLNPLVHLRWMLLFGSNIWSIRRILRSEQIDVVHTNGIMHLQAGLAAALEGIPVVWHLNDTNTPPLIQKVFLPIVKKISTGIVVAANAVGKHYFGDRVNLTDSRIDTLYAPVDTSKFSPTINGSAVRNEFGIDDDIPLIGVVGNLAPIKGIHHMIEAMPKIKQQHPTAKLLIIGDKIENRRSYWQGLIQRTHDLNIADDCIFAGKRNDMPTCFAAMDIFVLSSVAEACPMALLEASASGLPVVAAEVGGVREIVDDRVSGLVIKPENVEHISEAVIEIINSPKKARLMGEAGVLRMQAKFSLEVCVENHANIYTKALN